MTREEACEWMRPELERLRRRFRSHPEAALRQYERARANVRVLRDRLRAFQAWHNTAGVAEACAFLERAVHLAEERPDVPVWARGFLAGSNAWAARSRLLQACSPAVVDALFEADYWEVMFGERELTG